jgi:hypothetical protein
MSRPDKLHTPAYKGIRSMVADKPEAAQYQPSRLNDFIFTIVVVYQTLLVNLVESYNSGVGALASCDIIWLENVVACLIG